MAYYWLYNTSNDNIYILILIIVMLGLIIINFKLWTRKTDRFGDVSSAKWINLATGNEFNVTQAMYNDSLIQAASYTSNKTGQTTINGNTYTYVSPSPFGVNNSIFDSSTFNNTEGALPDELKFIYIYVTPTTTTSSSTPTTSSSTPTTSNTPTTTKVTNSWINLATGNPVNVTQEMYNDSLIQAASYTSNKTGQTTINGNTYTYVSPSPFGINNSIFDTSTFNNTEGALPDELKFIFIYVTQTTSSSTKPQTTSSTPTTTKVTGAWISLKGNPVNVTQEIYNMSVQQGLNTNYNKINTGSILINGITYNYLSPSPFRYGNANYNIIKDVQGLYTSQSSNPNDPNFIYIYVNSNSIPQSSIPQTTKPQSSIPQSSIPQASIPQSSIPQSSNPQSSIQTQTTSISQTPTQQPCITLPLCIEPPTQPQTTTYDNPLNPNFYISKEEEARRNAWSQLDGNEESLPNTNGTNPTYQNDILYNPNNGGLLNNSGNRLNLALTYSTIGDYATIDSLGAKLTDTIGGINSNLGYTVLDEQLGTFNNYSNTVPNSPNPNTYDNTANYNTGMNPYTVNGRSSGSGTVSSVGSGTSGKYTHDNNPIFMQKDFEGVSNIFAPNIYISNPPLTEDGNPDISFQM